MSCVFVMYMEVVVFIKQLQCYSTSSACFGTNGESTDYSSLLKLYFKMNLRVITLVYSLGMVN